MSTVSDVEIAQHFLQNEIAASVFEAAQRPFSESIYQNPDAALALKLQRKEAKKHKKPLWDNNEVHGLHRQEFDQIDSAVGQNLFDNEDRGSDQRDATRVECLGEALRGMQRSRTLPGPSNRMNFISSVRGPSLIGNPSFKRFGPANVTDQFPDINASNSSEFEGDSILHPPCTRRPLQRLQPFPNQQEITPFNDIDQAPNQGRVNITNPTRLQCLQRRGIANSEWQRVERQEDSSLDRNVTNQIESHQTRLSGMPRFNNDLEFYNDVETDEDTNEMHSPSHHRILPGMPRFGDVDHNHSSDWLTDFDIDTDDYEALWELQERNGDVRKQGLTKHQIRRIPHYKYMKNPGRSRSDEDCCRICLNVFEYGDTVKTLPCFHLFHKHCIDKWIKIQAVCPVCRENINLHY